MMAGGSATSAIQSMLKAAPQAGLAEAVIGGSR